MVHRTPFFLPWFYPTLTWRMPSHEKALYLTFDDGPVPGPTEFVLETLRHYKAKATFFCIGENIRKNPEVFKKVVSHGHALGNHTYNHLNGWRTRTEDYGNNVGRCQEEMAANGGRSGGKLFRPPYGRISRQQIRLLSAYNIIMWDVLSVDYNKNLSGEKCLKNSIDATRSGSIIVFHDSYKAERNLTFALPRFIEHFSNDGFTFRSIE
jgi:peptidoglycan/xylan/chitin deacetylase (PgdA/CDA1 family)